LPLGLILKECTMPGDPVRVLIRSPRISAETLARLRERFGLDESLLTQFWVYLQDLFTLDLGTSFNFRQPVLDVILERVPATLFLMGTATVLSIIPGIGLGVLLAWKRGSRIDVAGLTVSLLLMPCPPFG
jgi:peptide/nickel transport system permease protein